MIPQAKCILNLFFYLFYSFSLTANLKTQHYDYPFTVGQSLYNSISNVKGEKKPFDFYNIYGTGTLFNLEKTYNFNYGSTFDYTDSFPNQFISSQTYGTNIFGSSGCQANCRRCTDIKTNSCTECTENSKLFGGNCQKKNGKFLQMPISNYNDKFLELNVDDIVNNYYFEKKEIYTITIWLKYHGQVLTNSDNCVIIFRFTKNGQRYICYNSTTLTLYFYENGKIMYEDTKFVYNIGQWSLISLASFMNNIKTIEGLATYFKYRYNFFVNDQQLVQKPDVVINYPGWKFDTIQIGYGFSGIITDIRIYRNFITNPWGFINGPKNSLGIEFRFQINGKSNPKCITDQELVVDSYKSIRVENQELITTLGVNCVEDFSPYASGTSCSDGKFWDTKRFNESIAPCSDCEKSCYFNCANNEPNGNGCTCDWESADHALRIDETTKKTKCELLPYTEFSKLEEFSASDLKVGRDGEYSVEFWYYLYTYTNTTIPFESEEIIWDNHNKITLFAENGNMNVGCTPIYKHSSPKDYTFMKPESIINGLFTWTYISCSVNTNKNIFYGIRGNEWDIETPKYLFPDLKTLSTSSLIFRPGSKTPANYGMLFIKDIKLWSIYNIKRFDTKC